MKLFSVTLFNQWQKLSLCVCYASYFESKMDEICTHFVTNGLIITINYLIALPPTDSIIISFSAVRSKRSVIVKEFILCNYGSISIVTTCPAYRLAGRCSFFQTDQRRCSYKVKYNIKGSLSGCINCVWNHNWKLLIVAMSLSLITDKLSDLDNISYTINCNNISYIINCKSRYFDLNAALTKIEAICFAIT